MNPPAPPREPLRAPSGRCLFCDPSRRGIDGNDSNPTTNKISSHLGEPSVLTVRPTVFDRDVLALKPLQERIYGLLARLGPALMRQDVRSWWKLTFDWSAPLGPDSLRLVI